MKVNKKTSIISLFVAGTILFSSAALADVIIGDGYNGAKQAFKNTTKTLAKKSDSFSAEGAFEVKCDGKLIISDNTTTKTDLKNQKTSTDNKHFSIPDGESMSYNYRDSEKSIYKDGSDDEYYQYNFKEKQDVTYTDPFEEDIAKDIERIADAAVSNMKDFVQVKETEGGGKVYYGNLENSQIPALVNALSSVALKYSFIDSYQFRQSGIPEIKDGLYCVEVNGKASENADGILDSFAGKAIVSGKDKDGKEHTIELSCSVKVFDINSTVVDAPYVNPENISSDEGEDTSSYTCTKADIGTYKANVITTKDGEYTKTGERVLTITNVEGNTVTGTLTVTGSEQDMSVSFNAEIQPEKDMDGYIFEYTLPNGAKRSGVIQKNSYFSQYGEGIIMVHTNCTIYDTDNGNISWGYDNGVDENFVVMREF